MIEHLLEVTIFRSRWLLAPFYLGLVGAIGILMVKFIQHFFELLPHVLSMSENDVVLAILSFIDMSLAGNLLLMVIFAGYENFVSKIDAADHEDRPEWMGKVNFGTLKLKLLASIVAISGIHLLEAFMSIHDKNKEDVGWMVGIHMTFVVSGLLMAWMDKAEHQAESPHGH